MFVWHLLGPVDSLLQGEGYGRGELEQSPLTVQDMLVAQGEGH